MPFCGGPGSGGTSVSGHAAFLQERGEQLAAAYTHLWVSFGVLRAPRLSTAVGRWHFVAVLCLHGLVPGLLLSAPALPFTTDNGLGAFIDSAPRVRH